MYSHFLQYRWKILILYSQNGLHDCTASRIINCTVSLPPKNNQNGFFWLYKNQFLKMHCVQLYRNRNVFYKIQRKIEIGLKRTFQCDIMISSNRIKEKNYKTRHIAGFLSSYILTGGIPGFLLPIFNYLCPIKDKTERNHHEKNNHRFYHHIFCDTVLCIWRKQFYSNCEPLWFT